MRISLSSESYHRLTDQKGLDLVDRIMNDICCDGVQFIVLGTGDGKI